MVKTSWIYTLRKEELVVYLEDLKIDAEGNVDELRKRLISFLSKATPDELGYLMELEAKHTPGSSKTNTTVEPAPGEYAANGNEHSFAEDVQPLSEGPIGRRQETIPHNSPTTMDQWHDKVNITAIDKIRKWSVKYDGGRGPLPFVERVEELADTYDIPMNLIPRAMPELLKDKALTWYRSTNKRWKSWDQFH